MATKTTACARGVGYHLINSYDGRRPLLDSELHNKPPSNLYLLPTLFVPPLMPVIIINFFQISLPFAFIFAAIIPLLALFCPPTSPEIAPYSLMIHALNLCIASTIISITSLLNFSLASLLSILLGLPLTFASPPASRGLGFLKYFGYTMLGCGWMLFAKGEVGQALENWELLGGWFAPFVCVVYVPLVLQAGIVSLLPSS